MKIKTQYQCTECGAIRPKWAGQCNDCSAWNSLSEIVAAPSSGKKSGFQGFSGSVQAAAIHTLADVTLDEEMRVPTGISELDRVIGGGLVAGSVVLLGGDPGIGKSTLLIQMLASLAAGAKLKGLYVSGEESTAQIALRAKRLGLIADEILVVAETRVDQICEIARGATPWVLVIDSIQTVYTDRIPSPPGSVAQIRESAAELVRLAKDRGIAVFLVGHVTKEGALAGPRVLEHMVDTVLYFEGDESSRYRMIRAIKNRYGAVGELGVFAMTDRGLKEVSSPSAIFLSRHHVLSPGSVVMVTREGTRPLLVEVQALVDESRLSNPRRLSVGLDQSRLAMLLAVLHRHAGISTFDQDVFVNVVGGVRITETGADLAVISALLSSLRGEAIAEHTVVFGEVGLAGEIRPVVGGPERLREAAKHGFERAVIPHANVPKPAIKGLEIVAVSMVAEALAAI